MPTEIPQYSLGKILLVWAAAALPMAILGWLVAPALAVGSADPVFVRLAVLTVGLVWQFALVMLLLYREARTWRWSMLKGRLWLNVPRSPRTGGDGVPRCVLPWAPFSAPVHWLGRAGVPATRGAR